MQIPQLIDVLTQSHATTVGLLQDLDPELLVFKDPPWQVRDIMWHLAVWDREAAQSIQACTQGAEYAIPKFNEDAFNAMTIQEGRKLSTDQVRAAVNQARSEFKQAVTNFPEELLHKPFLYPWGDERGDLSLLVNYMVDHEAEHRDEIEAVFE